MADRSEQSSSNNSCKRKLNPEEWKRNKRTSLRNRGKEYETVSKSGRKHTFAAKQLGKDYHWLLKCFERVTQEQHENGSRGFLGAWRLDCTECFLMWKCESQVSKAKDAKKAETSWHSQKNFFLSILHKRQRNIYSGIQKGFLGHLSYIQWQAFLHSIKNAKCGISTNRLKG